MLQNESYLREAIRVPASVLSPQTWPFSLEWLPPTAYLVGGNVRDALLGRQAEYLDLDFVLPTAAVEIAKSIANHHRAGFVLLDAERQIARVVFERATADFALQVGASLEEDLHRRDFTVNAIAYSPHRQQFLDPLQGCTDLKLRQIRMIAPENLKEDPLRLLRAYRQAAQLGFSLEAETREAIRFYASLLKEIAAERVQGELNYLLSTRSGTPLLAAAWQDGLLASWLPDANSTKLARVAGVDRAVLLLEELRSAHEETWHWEPPKSSGTGRSWQRVAKLACLVSNALPIAEAQLWHLKYSRAEVQAVLAAQKSLPSVLGDPSQLSARSQYYLFREVGSAFPALVLAAVAADVKITTLKPLIQRFLLPDDPIAHPVPPLSGRDLMTQLQLPPSPQIGRLLEALQLARAEGHITTPQEALDWAKQLLQPEA